MLIVAALIALFSAIAVFSVSQQLNSNKQKAAVAECRQIATAMSFAQQDLGFFPKICWLRMSAPNLVTALSNYAVGNTGGKNYINELEYHSLPVATDVQGTLLDTKWKGAYGGFGQERTVKMRIPAEVAAQDATRTEFDWPGDPWGNPYVAYFIHTERTSDGKLSYRFINSPGEDPNAFAGIVSYGRNRVPGMREPGDQPRKPGEPPNNYATRKDLRLYKDGGSYNTFEMLKKDDFKNAKDTDIIRMILVDPASIRANEPPLIREQGSDDRFIEF
jgi:hypothetical protein